MKGAFSCGWVSWAVKISRQEKRTSKMQFMVLCRLLTVADGRPFSLELTFFQQHLKRLPPERLAPCPMS